MKAPVFSILPLVLIALGGCAVQPGNVTPDAPVVAILPQRASAAHATQLCASAPV